MLESRGLGSCGCCCRRICAGHVSLPGPLQPEPWVGLRVNGMSKNLMFDIVWDRARIKPIHIGLNSEIRLNFQNFPTFSTTTHQRPRIDDKDYGG